MDPIGIKNIPGCHHNKLLYMVQSILYNVKEPENFHEFLYYRYRNYKYLHYKYPNHRYFINISRSSSVVAQSVASLMTVCVSSYFSQKL